MKDILTALILTIAAIMAVSFFGQSPKTDKQSAGTQTSGDVGIILQSDSDIKIQMLSPSTGECEGGV